jgi:hypothetical protein
VSTDDSQQPSVEGTLMMGADGAIYFIPNEELEAFRVPDEDASEARASLEPEVEAYSAEFVQRYGNVSPEIKIVTSVQGAFGYLPQAGPTTIPGFVDFGRRSS